MNSRKTALYSYITRCILIVLCLFQASIILAQDKDNIDETLSDNAILVEKQTEIGSKVEFRVPSEEKIKKYREDKRFQYKTQKIEVPKKTLVFLSWLSDAINKLFSKTPSKGIPKEVFPIIIIAVIVVILVIVILKLSGLKFRALFGKKKLDAPEVNVSGEENVHEMEFSKLIKHAIEQNNYRLATRYAYLSNLKLLSDKEYIKWSPNKTNYSYQHEISDINLKNIFMETTLIFDYIWYGEFPIDKAGFTNIYSRMNEFSNAIINGKR